MIVVAVHTTRGPDPTYVQVNTDDELVARLSAYRFVWQGPTDLPPDTATLDECTDVVGVAATIEPFQIA